MAHRTTTHQAYDPRQVQEHIVETPLNEEMSKSFLEYAYSVIYARALPDARDGLKPVQRRIIYQMGQMNLTPDRPYMKSARGGRGDGQAPPHGDSAIYEAMVRLAQPFAMRLALVDGHGNFGSLDDGPAASRYTEARLAPAALGMNADIDEDTVDFTPNYDNKLKEPTVLPAAIPNLLVNGGSGIAVGMATNMATHNLGEVVAAAKHLMAHPDATLEELMRYVPPRLAGRRHHHRAKRHPRSVRDRPRHTHHAVDDAFRERDGAQEGHRGHRAAVHGRPLNGCWNAFPKG